MRIRGRLLATLAAGALGLGAVGLTSVSAPISAAPSVDTTSAIVLLQGDPVTTSVKVTNLLNQDIQQHIFGDLMKRSVMGELKISY